MATITYVEDGVTQLLEFDATLKEDHEVESEATTHDMERGADLADHVRVGRPTISMDVMVTNTPVLRGNDLTIGKLVGVRTPRVIPLTQAEGLPGGAQAPQFEVTYAPLVYTGFEAPYVPAGFYGKFRPRQDPTVRPGRYQANTHLSAITVQMISFLNPRDRLVDLWETFRMIQDSRQLVTLHTRLQDYSSMLVSKVRAPVTTADAISFSLSFTQMGFAESLVFSEVDKVRVAVKKAEPKKDEGPKATYTDSRQKHQSILDNNVARAAGYREPDEVLNTPRPR